MENIDSNLDNINISDTIDAQNTQSADVTGGANDMGDAGMTNAVTVAQLNKYIKSIMDNNANLARIAVKGEISNLTKHYSGHMYMSLKDESSSVRAVMFRSSASHLRFSPQNGMKIVALGRVSVFERDGQYQLYIDEMQAQGLGDLHIAYEQLKEKLKLEGLFDQRHKRQIPKFPHTVGVITSPTGAAVRDIINVITRRYPLCKILLHPVLVQGDGAAEQIADTIRFFNQRQLADVLIVGRGGGSIEDLWAFNEEQTVRAVAASEIPVISAVGHETDFTLCDFASDLRAPTPSAAAELAVPSSEALLSNLRQMYSRMNYVVKNTMQNKRATLSRFAVKTPLDNVNQNRMYLDSLTKNLTNAVGNCLNRDRRAFAVTVAKLDTLSPLCALSRGYALAESDGELLRDAARVSVGDEISVRLDKGSLRCTVNEVTGG